MLTFLSHRFREAHLIVLALQREPARRLLVTLDLQLNLNFMHMPAVKCVKLIFEKGPMAT